MTWITIGASGLAIMEVNPENDGHMGKFLEHLAGPGRYSEYFLRSSFL